MYDHEILQTWRWDTKFRLLSTSAKSIILFRSTPRRDDSVWDGTDDLSAALGFERDGETTILFRRKLATGGGKSDHDILNEEMHVIWAIGQEPDNYFHAPK